MIRFELEGKFGEKKFKQQLEEGYFEEEARLTNKVNERISQVLNFTYT